MIINKEEWKLLINLLEAATTAVKYKNFNAALRDVTEAEQIIAHCPLDPYGAHMYQRVAAIRQFLNERGSHS